MKVMTLLYPGQTPQDIIGPLTAFSVLPGYEAQFVWRQPGPVRSDTGLSLVATHSFAQSWKDPDILLVGGGAAPTLALLDDQETLDFLAERGAKAQWITSVCTGSLVLGAAGLLRGYRSACHWAAREALTAFGAIPSPERVVFDRNRASGGGVTAGLDFGLALVARLQGEPFARMVELAAEYAPEPPYGCGRPEIADAATLAAAVAFFGESMPMDAVGRAAQRLSERESAA
jgi:cyclohexyl-isocyanide hydratase